MKEISGTSTKAAELRRRAEERLKRQRPEGGGHRTEVETARLVHELEVHQIELEMQNEQLRQAYDQAETLQEAHERLELRVQERTAELAKANEALRIEIVERKQAEAALRESEGRYRELFDKESDAIMVFDAETHRFEDANLAALSLYGYTREELLAFTPEDISAEPDQTRAPLALISRGDAVPMVTVRYQKKKDGTVFPVEISSGSFFVGGRRKIIGAVRDITERKRAEEKIQALSKFPSENPNPVLRIARDGTLLYINEAGLRLLPQWHLEVGHASPPMLREAVFQSMDNGSTQVLDLEHGECVYSFFVAPIAASGYANLYGRDITERRWAEVALRNSRNMLHTVLDSIPSGVFWKDRDSTYLGGNRTWLEAAGLKSSEGVVGKSDYDLPWEKEQARRYRKHDRKVIESGIPEYNIIEPYRRADGTPAWARTNKVPLRDTEGNVVGVLGTYEDITERKRAEERMQVFAHEIIAARENERKQVSSALHHDVGSLAVGVSAHLQAIEDDLRSGKREGALKWVKRTRRLFDESVVRLKGLAIQLRPPELDVLGLRAALRQHFSQVTRDGDIRIHLRETLGRKRVTGDTATTLFRVAQEALTNAITHGHATRVDVGLRASKKEVRLTVRDNGKGFDPSGQRTRVTSQMGLPVMREMAAFDGGVFTIDSGPGKGTTVRMSLPLKTVALVPRDVTVEQETVAPRKTTRSAGRGSRPQKESGA